MDQQQVRAWQCHPAVVATAAVLAPAAQTQALQTALPPPDLEALVVATLLVVHLAYLRADHQAGLQMVLLEVVVAVLQQPVAMLHLEAW